MLVRFNKRTIIEGDIYEADAEEDIANDLADQVVREGNGVVVGLGSYPNEARLNGAAIIDPVSGYVMALNEIPGMSPNATAAANIAALQRALDANGFWKVTTPGVYEVDEEQVWYSNTTLYLGPGVEIKSASTYSGRMAHNANWKSNRVSITGVSAVSSGTGKYAVTYAAAGHDLAAGDYVLIKNDTALTHNGVWLVDSVTAGVDFTVTRHAQDPGALGGSPIAYKADANIRIFGEGRFNSDGRGSSGLGLHGSIFNKVGNLKVEVPVDGALKYGVFGANIHKGYFKPGVCKVPSAAVQLLGPCYDVTFDDAAGEASDDMLAITTSNAGAPNGYLAYDLTDEQFTGTGTNTSDTVTGLTDTSWASVGMEVQVVKASDGSNVVTTSSAENAPTVLAKTDTTIQISRALNFTGSVLIGAVNSGGEVVGVTFKMDQQGANNSRGILLAPSSLGSIRAVTINSLIQRQPNGGPMLQLGIPPSQAGEIDGLTINDMYIDGPLTLASTVQNAIIVENSTGTLSVKGFLVGNLVVGSPGTPFKGHCINLGTGNSVFEFQINKVRYNFDSTNAAATKAVINCTAGAARGNIGDLYLNAIGNGTRAAAAVRTEGTGSMSANIGTMYGFNASISAAQFTGSGSVQEVNVGVVEVDCNGVQPTALFAANVSANFKAGVARLKGAGSITLFNFYGTSKTYDVQIGTYECLGDGFTGLGTSNTLNIAIGQGRHASGKSLFNSYGTTPTIKLIGDVKGVGCTIDGTKLDATSTNHALGASFYNSAAGFVDGVGAYVNGSAAWVRVAA